MLNSEVVPNRDKYSAICGVGPNTTNPFEQLCMFRKYVVNRYGTAEKALEFRKIEGWY